MGRFVLLEMKSMSDKASAIDIAKSVICALLLGFVIQAQADESLACPELLGKVQIESYKDDLVKVNGVGLTGDFIYPVEMVVHNLGLSAEDLKAFYSAEALSLGEGVSGLIPFLQRHGLQAKGLDLWYSESTFPENTTGKIMKDYLETYGDSLVTGDARKTSFPDGKFELVLSHLLINNMDFESQLRIIDEALRITQSKGQIRIFGFNESEAEVVGLFLDHYYSGKIKYHFDKKFWDHNYQGVTSKKSGMLLVIQKL